MRKTIVMAVVALLVLGLAAPAALAKAEHTDFYGLYFPAGMPGTETECPHTWVDPAFCVMDKGAWDELPSGRLRIRDMTIFELALVDTGEDVVVEPRKTGYDIVVANADLDKTFSGPTWGTWNLYSFENELMFTGTFTGKFENGIPAVHFVGQGTGSYEGQKMRGDIGRVPDPYNMFGTIIEPGLH